MTLQAFLNKYGSFAIDSKKNGIFPIVTLAVAYLESNKPGGISKLAEKYNNFHGIQSYPKWKGQTVTLQDNLKGDNRVFCVYPTVQAGFNGFSQFLKDNPRYTRAGVFKAATPVEQIQKIGDAGYSETSTWKTAVTKISKLWNEATASAGGKLIPIIIFGVVVFWFLSKKN
jgi:flagellum-specific peptidoglycan hydrolase FlgJ